MNDNNINLAQLDMPTGTIDDQAEDWLIYLYSGAATDEGVARWRHWLRQNPLHQNAYARVEQLWRNMGYTDGTPDEADFASVKEREAAARTVMLPKARRRNGWFNVAATIAVIAMAGVAGVWGVRNVETHAHYASAPGEIKTVQLADGSQVTLGGDTVLETAFSMRRRKVALLHGGAYFQVTHDASRPFRVQVEGVTVTVTGTRFDVRKDPQAVRVSVVEGHVRVGALKSDKGQEVHLNAGDQVTATSSGVPGAVIKFLPEEALAWQQGHLIYNDEKLSTVVAEVNRYRTKPIRLADKRLDELPVSLIVPTGDTDRLLSALSAGEDVAVDRQASEVVISRRH